MKSINQINSEAVKEGSDFFDYAIEGVPRVNLNKSFNFKKKKVKKSFKSEGLKL